MASAFWDEVAFDLGTGKKALLLPGETVSVFNDLAGALTAVLTPLFSNEALTVSLANPTVADSLGNITFWADAVWVWVKVGTRAARRVRLSTVGPTGATGAPGTAAAAASTKAALGTPTAGEIRRVTDDVRGLWFADGTQWKGVNGEIVNVKDFGVKGDGTLETAANVAAASLAAAGKTLYWPAGTYLLPLQAHPSSATTYAMVFVYNKTRMIGAGREATILKLPNSTAKPGGATSTNLIRNLSAGDEQILIEDLTVDGNGGNQTGQTMQHQGVIFNSVKGAFVKGIKVQNLHGLGYAPDAPTVGDVECMGISFNQCSQSSATDCEVVRTAGSTSTGFSANTSTNVAFVNCRARGMTVSNGFTHNGCRNIVHSNCEAYDNALFGFNSENSEAMVYASCISGGRAANTGGLSSIGYTVDENLGNGDGWRFFGAVGFQLAGCIGRYNVGNGVTAQSTSSGNIIGGAYTNNGSAGLRGDSSSTGLMRIVGWPILTSNTAGEIVGLGTGFPSRDLFGFLKVNTSPHIAANSHAFVQVRDDGGTLNPEIRFYRPTGTGLWRCWSIKANAASPASVLEILSGDQAAVGSETLTSVLTVDLAGRTKPVGGIDTRIVPTASLPAAAAAMNGHMLIEDAGAGNRNLIIYAGSERFRIDGGAAF